MKKTLILAALILMTVLCMAVGAETYGDLTYTVSNGEIAITDCSESATDVEIPAEINGYPVTSIGNKAFSDCQSLTSVTLPESIVCIGEKAFYNCQSLSSIIIPNKVSSIENHAFKHCTNLTSVTIGNGLRNIGDSAFFGCTNLTSINIPSSVENIGRSAFANCFLLSDVYITSIYFWLRIDFVNQSSNPLDNEVAELILNKEKVTSVTIPDKLTEIKPYAFVGCKTLISVTLHDNVTSIGHLAFANCINLASINLPESVINIGNCSFYDTDLTSVVIPENITVISDGMFSSCDKLASVSMGSYVTYIGEYAFDNCTKLTTIEIPESVTSIGQGAFYYCKGLSKIIITDRIKSIGEYAFYGCSQLTIYGYKGSYVHEYSANNDISFEIIPSPYSIDGISLLNTDFNIVPSIPTTAFFAEVTVTNIASSERATILIATYDTDGRMLDIDFLYANPQKGQTVTFGTQIKNTNGNVEKVKAFVVSDLKSFNTLAEAKEIIKA